MNAARIHLIALIFAVVAISGCDSNSLKSDETVPVSLTVHSVGSVANAAGALGKSGHVEITRARILLRTIQFHSRTDDGFDDDSDDDSDDNAFDFRTDPLVLDLNVDGTPTEVEVTDIPEGIYHKVSFRIHKPEDFETPPDPDFKVGTSGDERFSMIIEGLHNGQPFVYRSTKSMQQKIRLNPDLVVDATFAGPLNVALQVDMSRWFVDDDGVHLDPTVLDSGGESEIDKTLRDSFRAFRDNDRDGLEDDDADDDDDDDDSDDDDDDNS